MRVSGGYLECIIMYEYETFERGRGKDGGDGGMEIMIL